MLLNIKHWEGIMGLNNSSSSKAKKYITYFQSVITIGIMNRADNGEKALKNAKSTMHNGNIGNCCAFEQTPFEPTWTEEWQPEFEHDLGKEGLAFRFNPDEKTKNIIATKLGKNTEDLTDSDCENFVKQSIDSFLVR